MAFDLIVRTFLADNGLSAGLARANAGLNQLGKSGPGARAGLRAVEIGARQLAFEAAGLSGGLGNLARGLLQFGGGSAMMLGATAGIGALALAYRHFTKDSREAAEAQKALHDSLIRTARARAEGLLTESGRIGRDIGTVRGELADRNRERAARVAALGDVFLARGFNTLDEAIRADSKIAEIDKKRAELSLAIALNRGAETRALREQADALAKISLAEHARSEALTREFGSRFATGDTRFRPMPSFADTGPPPTRIRGGPLPMEAPFTGAGGPPLDLKNELKRSSAELAALIVGSLGQALVAFQAGGAGGALAGGGAILSGLSGIKGLGGLGPFGMVASALGGVASLFDRGADRREAERERREAERHRELIGVLREGPMRVQVFLSGESAAESLYNIARLERLGGEPRLG